MLVQSVTDETKKAVPTDEELIALLTDQQPLSGYARPLVQHGGATSKSSVKGRSALFYFPLARL